MHKLLVIDNYDSFTFNLVQGFAKLGAETSVFRNDQITLEQAQAYAPSHLLISPGPGRPSDSGMSESLFLKFYGQIPILGICLGHQLIAETQGGELRHADKEMHGKSDWITHDNSPLFHGLPNPMRVGRYHSLIVKSPPPTFTITARTKAGEIMGISNWVGGIGRRPLNKVITLCGAYDRSQV